MEGRFPRGIRYVLTNPQDPTRESDFNYWYNYIHIPDLLEVGIVQRPTRYEAVTPHRLPFELNPIEGKFLALWEVDRIDIHEAVMESLSNIPRLRQLGRIWEPVQMTWWQAFKTIGPLTRPSGKRVTGILVAMTNCNDPLKEKEFNDWYDNRHLPLVLSTGLYHMAYRLESYVPPKPGEPKYIAIYETDAEDLAEAEKELLTKYRPNWEAQGLLNPFTEVLWLGSFRRIFPVQA